LEKLGGEQFTEGDERVLVSLAAQVGVAYENAQRYRDIQNHAAELELCVEKRTAELQASNADLEAFSYSVSHDLRGPLMHLSGYSSILLDKYGITLNEEANGFLHRINQAAMRMSHLIDDLLKLAKVSRQQLDFQEVSLGSLVEEVIKGLDVDGHVPKIDWRIGPLPHIQCDYGLMRQVLINLLSNAVKYTGTRDRPEIEIGLKTIDDRPTFFVRDNGVGFDMKHADKLFAPFERLHRDQDFQGSGVGLATVQRIIGKHGGRIWAEAEAGNGATFYFTVASEVPSITPHPYQPATAV
jgi:light-regulated signal transduction histidine kinase (bacteriophytochrome)